MMYFSTSLQSCEWFLKFKKGEFKIKFGMEFLMCMY